jgi:hypothetical protein
VRHYNRFGMTFTGFLLNGKAGHMNHQVRHNDSFHHNTSVWEDKNVCKEVACRGLNAPESLD